MASGYITSDGKDLDARYLGINSKAVSAGYADSAGSAGSATTAGALSQKAFVYRNGTPVVASVPKKNGGTYTVPLSGLLIYESGKLIHVNSGTTKLKATIGDKDIVFVHKGDSLKSEAYAENVTIVPIYVQ